MASEDEIKKFILDRMLRTAGRKGVPAAQVTEDCNVLELGLVDSMGFLQLITAIEDHFGIAIDFSRLQPGAFTSLKGLAAQAARSSQDA